MQDEGEGGFDDEIMDEEEGSEGKKATKAKKPHKLVKESRDKDANQGKD
jgi:hypothetical protein